MFKLWMMARKCQIDGFGRNAVHMDECFWVVWVQSTMDLSLIKRDNIRRVQENTDVVRRENKILDWLTVVIVLPGN